MSIKLMTCVWEREDLNPTQKLVLLALCDWANDEGLCWPSINRLAIKTSMASRSVQRIIRELEQMHFVRREETPGKGNRYWCTIPMTECHPCHSVTPPLTESHPTPDTVSPNTLKIPQLDTNLIVQLQPDDPEYVSVQDVVEYWNEIATKIGKPKVLRMSPQRQQIIKARIRENHIDDFVAVFKNIERSQFLRNWQAMGFDWVFKAGNFQKILEGNYND